jgi:2-polyprenyl-3-methyl-5-hydroxy-6-metoxy-1,4-benzoquinol methylase
MIAATPALKDRLDEFLASVPVDQLSIEIAKRGQSSQLPVTDILSTYINEARVSFALVENHLDTNSRILEVGAGLCLLSLFLKKEGHSIVALEPALGGFGLFETAKQVVLDHFSDISLQVLTCTAGELNPKEHGSYDLIFSNNVMEHIPDWAGALRAMQAALSPAGIMRHSCPNYTVPYEPHYGIPVFRHFPVLSRRLFLSASTNRDIWNSLNFITCRQIRCFCRKYQLACDFEKELLYRACMRILDDPVFKERHQGFIARLAALIIKSPLRHLIRRIPATFATPMIFTISKGKQG